MRTIGKITALAMTLSLAFVLTACGGSASSSAAASNASESASAAASDTSAQTSSASASASASAAASSASAQASSASASAAASSSSAQTDSASASDESSVAAEEADVYDNEYFGIKFELPEGWSFVDTTTVDGVNQIVSAASESSSIDMVALNESQSQIVVVGIDTPSDETAGMTAEDYLEAQEEQLKTDMGGNYVFTTVSATMTFDGVDRELPASITNADVNGGHLCIGQAIAEKDGAFFSVIIMAETEDEVMSVFEYFSGTAV